MSCNPCAHRSPQDGAEKSAPVRAPGLHREPRPETAESPEARSRLQSAARSSAPSSSAVPRATARARARPLSFLRNDVDSRRRRLYVADAARRAFYEIDDIGISIFQRWRRDAIAKSLLGPRR